MKKALIFGLALALAGGVAYANYCARDYVPAATLLVPYAAVEMDSTGLVPASLGGSTLLWVTNVSAEKQLIHISVWSARSQAVVDFDEILSGYDVWRIDFKDLLSGHFDYFDTTQVSGFWYTPSGKPVGTGGTNFGNIGTPWGPSSNCYQPQVPAPQDTDYGTAYTGCGFPYGYHPEYGSGIVRILRNDIWFLEEQWSWCAGKYIANPPWLDALTRNPLFFYVTVDAVRACSRDFPNSLPYWTAPTPDNQNVLIGDIIYINYQNNQSDSIPAVHIEYDPDGLPAHPGLGYPPYFYTQLYGPGTTGLADQLEPLATAFAFRYMNAGGVSSELVVWKSSWDFDLYSYLYYDEYVWNADGMYVYFAWDENENSKTRGVGPSGFDTPEPNVIPFETQKVPLNTANWSGLMAGDGWMLLVFDPSVRASWQEFPFQAWVGVAYNLVNITTGVPFSTMTEAATMANAWCFPDQTLERTPRLGINYDYDYLHHIFQ